MLLEFALPSVRSHAYSGPERRGDVAAQTLRAVMDEIDYGVVVVSHLGRVIHMNHAARQTLAGDHPLEVVGSQLRARLLEDDLPVREALAAAAGRHRRCMLNLGPARARVSVVVVPLPQSAQVPEGATLLMFNKRQVCEELSVEAFARGHRLTGTETQVLKALCAGARPAEVAQTQGVQLSTVRTQIGSIRAKTGAATLRDLVQQVARLPPMTTTLRVLP
ncbi:MAG: helix-turn-helix transcriptional regulator, partial [Aquincola sp.]|nr:helix-turn-helix transcriptional regulator [Aquincola sp.]|tara:strand:- start:1509 stop:2168 length:660 start_codon:yes stop_codon:yes gene_type:complete